MSNKGNSEKNRCKKQGMEESQDTAEAEGKEKRAEEDRKLNAGSQPGKSEEKKLGGPKEKCKQIFREWGKEPKQKQTGKDQARKGRKD